LSTVCSNRMKELICSISHDNKAFRAHKPSKMLKQLAYAKCFQFDVRYLKPIGNNHRFSNGMPMVLKYLSVMLHGYHCIYYLERMSLIVCTWGRISLPLGAALSMGTTSSMTSPGLIRSPAMG
jgi:hypothetical protein